MSNLKRWAPIIADKALMLAIAVAYFFGMLLGAQYLDRLGMPFLILIALVFALVFGSVNLIERYAKSRAVSKG